MQAGVLPDPPGMTPLGRIQTSLLVSSLALLVVLEPILIHQLHRHLRRHHRQALDRAGIPSGASFIWKASVMENDREADHSSVLLDRFFDSGNHRTLEDRRLDALWGRVRLIRWLACAGLVLLALTWLVSGSVPGYLRDVLTS